MMRLAWDIIGGLAVMLAPYAFLWLAYGLGLN